MGSMRKRIEGRVARGLAAVLEKSCLAACVWLIAAGSGMGQVAVRAHDSDSSVRLLSLEEGRAIVNVAWQQEQMEAGLRDCSHFVHQIYANAGFVYAYASSFEIYAGDQNFVRVKNPHPGDLIAWRGHVGIVVDPLEHSFYSLVRTGLEAQDYRSAYWRSRGTPRFFRYKVEEDRLLRAANTTGSSRVSIRNRQEGAGRVFDERRTALDADSNRPPAAVSKKADVIYGPPAAPEPAATGEADAAFEIPTSVVIATGNKAPTREEVAEGISEIGDAQGSVLRSGDDLSAGPPVVIVEQFRVERVEVKRDHGWARLVVDSKVTIGGGAAQVKRRHEKVRWELRRTDSGWEAVAPPDRNYVPHDVAVKNLAEQLARLANSDGATEHQPNVLRQESQLAGVLSVLLDSKSDR